MYLMPQNLPPRSPRWRSLRGLTVVEVIVAIALLSLLLAAGLSAITTLKNMSRRQGTYNSVLALVEGKQEWFRSQLYTPPTAPFLATTNTLTETVNLSLNEDGVSNIIPVTLTCTVEVVSAGHRVTVTATYTQRSRPVTITLQTIVNAHSIAGSRLS
jgi:type II secretory pathway pseudopilin PulG